MIVMKFGGTSIGRAERILAIGEIVRERCARKPVVVVSALAGVTDLLESAGAAARRNDREALEPILADLERRHRWALSGSIEDPRRKHDLSLEIDRLFEELRQLLRSIRILGEGTPRAVDTLLAFGETLSAKIVTAAFRERGLPARAVDPCTIMVTDRSFGAAEPHVPSVRRQARERLVPLLESGTVPVMGGFVGASSEGETTTLGRGGSDTSAAVLGSALEAEEIQIWTDVDGLMTADPRIVPAARTLPRVSFAEASELAHYGARVLHPASIAPAVRRQIPVRVLNSLRPDGPGTVVVGGESSDGGRRLASVASRRGVSCVRVTSRRMRADAGFLPRILGVFDEMGIVPDLVLSSEVGAALIMPERVDPATAGRALESDARVEIADSLAIVCVVGSGLAHDGRCRADVIAALAEWEPEILGVGGSRTSLTAVVRQAQLEPAVRALHRRFFEEERAE